MKRLHITGMEYWTTGCSLYWSVAEAFPLDKAQSLMVMRSILESRRPAERADFLGPHFFVYSFMNICSTTSFRLSSILLIRGLCDPEVSTFISNALFFIGHRLFYWLFRVFHRPSGEQGGERKSLDFSGPTLWIVHTFRVILGCGVTKPLGQKWKTGCVLMNSCLHDVFPKPKGSEEDSPCFAL